MLASDSIVQTADVYDIPRGLIVQRDSDCIGLSEFDV